MSAESKHPWAAFLDRFTINDVVPGDQNLVTVTTETTVEQAIKLLHKANVLSVPIFDRNKKEFVGMVNVFDIATAIAFKNLFAYDDEQLRNLTEDQYNKAQHVEIFNQPVTSCLGISDESRLFAVFRGEDKVTKVIDMFSQGMHRALVRNDVHSLVHSEMGWVRVISQTDVVRFLHANSRMGVLSALFHRTVADLGLTNGVRKAALVVLDKASTALTGFRQMSLRKVSALAVVGDDGRILSCLSISDLRGMTQATFRDCLLPVTEFLKKVRAQHHDVVVCTAQDTLMDVVQKCLGGKVHRVWVVDNEKTMKPLGVITLTDILYLFFH